MYIAQRAHRAKHNNYAKKPTKTEVLNTLEFFGGLENKVRVTKIFPNLKQKTKCQD